RTAAFKGRFMAARHNPGFIGNPRRIRTESHVVSAGFYDAQTLPLFLRQNVAENAALLALKIVAAGAQFVEHAARHERGRSELRCGVIEFLSRSGAMILEDADVLEPAIALQILDALC